MRWRNARYEKGSGVEEIDRPVISIGNISVGGTGKSPMVSWCAQTLREEGHQPVIAMRGYKAPPGQPGDEELEYHQRVPDVPVIARPDRTSALREFFAEEDHDAFDCVILDDGFQHRQLARDCDIVLIDATQHTFDDRVLPAGRLREPLSALARADAVVVTRAAEHDGSLEYLIRKSHGKSPVAWTRHVWNGLDLHGPEPAHVQSDWLKRKRLISMLGVGHPAPIEAQILAAGAMVRRRIPVRDHQAYDARFLDAVRDACTHPQIDGLFVTPKDWVKLCDLVDWSSWPCAVIVPALKLEVFRGEDALRVMLVDTVRSAPDADEPRP